MQKHRGVEYSSGQDKTIQLANQEQPISPELTPEHSIEKKLEQEPSQKKTNPCLKALAEYVEQEAFELEMLPVLEDLIADLDTLPTRKSLPLIPVSPNSDMLELATRSITSFIEQTAVEFEITEVAEELTEELKQIQPKKSIPIKKLDMAISHLLQELEAVSPRKQQEVRTHALEALSNYIEHSAVEKAVNPQALQTLTSQFSSVGDPKLVTAMQQLEVIVTSYQAHLQKQALVQAVEGIRDYHEQTAISEALAQDVERLVQNLSQLGESQLPKQLQQLSRVIEQYRQQMEAQLNPAIQKQIDALNEQKLPTDQKAQALKQQRLVYRQKYQELQKRVRSYHGFSNSLNWEVDIGIALLVVKELSDPNEVGRVLTQSDQLQEWKALLPEDEYLVKGKAYIQEVYEQAQQLREMRSLQQQKRDLDLEL